MKRSNDPVLWAPFGAGGMLSALIGPVLVLITGIAAPLGVLAPKDTMSYANMLAFAHNPIGKLAILAVIALFVFHGALRLFHSFHDIGVPLGEGGKLAFFGFGCVCTLATIVLLLRVG